MEIRIAFRLVVLFICAVAIRSLMKVHLGESNHEHTTDHRVIPQGSDTEDTPQPVKPIQLDSFRCFCTPVELVPRNSISDAADLKHVHMIGEIVQDEDWNRTLDQPQHYVKWYSLLPKNETYNHSAAVLGQAREYYVFEEFEEV